MMLSDINLPYRLCAIIGLLPQYSGAKHAFQPTKWKPIAFVAFLVFTVCYWTTIELHPKLLFNIDMCASVIVAVGIMQLMYATNYPKRTTLEKFFRTLHRCHALCEPQMELDNPRNRIICANFILLCITLLDAYCFTAMWSLRNYIYILCIEILIYLNFIVNLFEAHVLYGIKLRYKSFNRQLARGSNADDLQLVMRKLIGQHSLLSDLVDGFNELFGWHTLFTHIHVLLNLLSCINILVLWDDAQGHVSGFVLLLILTVYLVLALVVTMEPEYALAYKFAAKLLLLPKCNSRVVYWKPVLITTIITMLYAYYYSYAIGNERMFESVKVVIDLLAGFFVHAGLVSFIWIAHHFQRHKLDALSKSFQQINQIYAKYTPEVFPNYYKIALGLQLILFVITCDDLYIWISRYEVFMYTFVISYEFLIYLNFLICLVEWFIIRAIHNRLRCFNELLSGNALTVALVLDLIRAHRECCDAVDAVNRLFGWHMFFSCMQSLLNTLSCITLFLIHIDIDAQGIVLMVLWTSYILIQSVVVATMCEHVVAEGRESISISYRMLHRYALDGQHDALREKLWLLAHQATARCPRFSAAGFFNVDYAMLFTFINLITTYVIVVIQFSKN